MYNFGIKGSVGLYWIQNVRQRTYYLQPPPQEGKGQGILFQLHASATGISHFHP